MKAKKVLATLMMTLIFFILWTGISLLLIYLIVGLVGPFALFSYLISLFLVIPALNHFVYKDYKLIFHKHLDSGFEW
ncbi:hypothetical protein COX95_03025 [bacterium CG_4_10_14_0_2_um_filter_33_32]|nr:MAG: hypothetical protein AUJ93_00100 [bacterium CG2_30_33_46]PIR67849.1 MAG: hypothetical protein COU50_01010 [bacterium CG10_big_fil_rev_8_21_14_0_10_33_18]PIU77173.1 MAG: hypothetical protein COS74_00185 [bacterium CG06_land_8_20_14_3_00_33_50]PIW81427.1 MAG: hypothetical protein COZ97_01855 [bacterium CG_4_8_14_3_um_filter_33_28]PIY85641.1 MAG: hypothetical protein COY76_01095 [bacterium CG_4_10_14_0_8_um_filter_33_57]PIZ85750.1 MAG: hypothetical protein COX95_03025 [bacterium CG_4_10_1